MAVEESLRESSPSVKLYKGHDARDRILSEDEYNRLLKASSPHLRRLLLCAYETGMRAGEIKRLTWDKVDFKTGFIWLSAADTTKTNKK